MIVSAVEAEAKNLVKQVGRNNVNLKILNVSDQMDQVQAELKDADVVLSLLMQYKQMYQFFAKWALIREWII